MELKVEKIIMNIFKDNVVSNLIRIV